MSIHPSSALGTCWSRQGIPKMEEIFQQIATKIRNNFYLLQLKQQVVLELSVNVDLSFRFLVLVQRLLDAVFGVELWISALVDVLEDSKRYVDVF